MRQAESEKKTLEDNDPINSLGILAAIKSSEEPAPRNGTGKSRKNNKQILESDVIDSPTTPVDSRGDVLKRIKGNSQRSSSVASQNRVASVKEDVPEPKADKTGPLSVGTDVFYRIQPGEKDEKGIIVEGAGQHQVIKKILQDKKG
jgi:hypothetical protein